MSNINSVDNTQSEEMRQVVKYFAANMMKSCLKSSMGEDNNNFDLMYEALLESLEDKTSSISTMLDEVCDSMMGTSQSAIGNNSSSSNEILTAAGTDLNSLAMVNRRDLQTSINNYVQGVNGTSNISYSNCSADILSLVNKYSSQYGVNPNLVMAVINAESSFNPNATSSAGAKGLMQLMPCVCSEFGVTNPYDPDQNIKAGVQLLKQHLNNYNGDTAMALMAYNAGAGTVSSRGVRSANDLYKMPSETQNYVTKIMSALEC